jgi:phage shock protein A
MTLRRLLHEFLAPAPDPRQSYRRSDCLEVSLMADLSAAIDTITAARNQLAARTAKLRERLQRLESEAREALVDGREDLARRTLEQRQIAAGELELLERQLHTAEREAGRLARAEQQLIARVEARRAQERMLEARESAAAIQVRVGEALAGISADIDDVAPELERAEQRTEELEARAAAIDHLLSLRSIRALETAERPARIARGSGSTQS